MYIVVLKMPLDQTNKPLLTNINDPVLFSNLPLSSNYPVREDIGTAKSVYQVHVSLLSDV